MKQRLIEMRDFSDPDEAETARLLRSMPPTAVSEVVERRVYARVCAPRLRGPRFVRLTVLASALLVSTTILCATLARHWLGRSDDRSPRSPALSVPVAQPKRLVAQREPAPESAPADSTPVSPSATDEGGAAATVHTSAHRDRLRGFAAARRPTLVASDRDIPREELPPPEVAAAPPPPEEAALVLSALRALRREHNPVQAGALLQTYLARFPKGVLTEEALALGIEAAVARQDARFAAILSNQYLGRYPAGRFVALARKTSSATRP
jgi:hypothetical protein